MPAEYIDMGPFGVGVSFPKRPLLEGSIRWELKKLGFEKKALFQHYLAPRSKTNIYLICDFIREYNKEYYPEANPVKLPDTGQEHICKG
jgi:hypothetical protein